MHRGRFLTLKHQLAQVAFHTHFRCAGPFCHRARSARAFSLFSWPSILEIGPRHASSHLANVWISSNNYNKRSGAHGTDMDVGLPLVWFSWASLKSTTPEVSLRKGARGPEPATDRKNRPPSPPHGTEGDLADFANVLFTGAKPYISKQLAFHF